MFEFYSGDSKAYVRTLYPETSIHRIIGGINCRWVAVNNTNFSNESKGEGNVTLTGEKDRSAGYYRVEIESTTKRLILRFLTSFLISSIV